MERQGSGWLVTFSRSRLRNGKAAWGEPGEIVLDFQEVTFVDADGVQSRVVCETKELTIVPCPPGPNISIAPTENSRGWRAGFFEDSTLQSRSHTVE